MVAFEIFGLSVRWYGVMIALGIFAAFLVVSAIMKKLKYKDDIPFELLLILVPVAILGARLVFIVLSGVGFSEFFNFKDGIEGIAIYGAVFAGAAGALIYCLFIRKCSFFALSDIIVIGLILAQSIGRWGNFFNKELYGFQVDFNFFPLTVDIYGEFFLALFFYESFLNLIGFFILLKIFSKQKRWGTTTAAYFIYYGIVRALLEPLRLEEFILYFLGVPAAVITSGLAIIGGLLVLWLNKKGKIPQDNLKLLKEETE